MSATAPTARNPRVSLPTEQRANMIAAESLPRMSVSDYLAFERESDIRHELVNGELRAMVGGKSYIKSQLAWVT